MSIGGGRTYPTIPRKEAFGIGVKPTTSDLSGALAVAHQGAGVGIGT